MSDINLPEGLSDWPLRLVEQRFSGAHHGDYQRWQQAVDDLPAMSATQVDLTDKVTVNGTIDNDALTSQLQVLHPWRKGPFQIGSVFIDTEWRSDWKWQRVASALGDLTDHRILDIGCGNGYFGWRMLGAGAAEVIGIDPTLLFCMQHQAISRYIQGRRNWVLPLKIEEIPSTEQFDTTLSMGVIYHRRDPQAHAQQLFELTKPGGQSLLETLVVSGEESLIPEQRYARMRNVWCVPTTAQVVNWMQNAGFVDVQVVDVSSTNLAEQRTTDWMRFESLAQALDPNDASLTVEGYPAPIRAAVIGHRG